MIAVVNPIRPRVRKKVCVVIENMHGGLLAKRTIEVNAATPDLINDQISGAVSDIVAAWYFSIGDTIRITEAT